MSSNEQYSISIYQSQENITRVNILELLNYNYFFLK